MRQTMKQYVRLGIFLIGILIFTIGCENEVLIEDQDPTSQSTQINNFKGDFSASLINEKLLLGKDNLHVDWENASIVSSIKNNEESVGIYKEGINDEQVTVYELDMYLKNEQSIVSDLFYRHFTYKLLISILNDQISYTVVRYEPLKESKNVAPSMLNLNGFSGNKRTINLQGDTELLGTYIDGLLVAQLDTRELDNDSFITSKEDDIPCEGCYNNGASSMSYYRLIFTEHFTDWYKQITYGGDTTTTYMSTRYDGTTVSQQYVGAGGNAMPSYHSSYIPKGTGGYGYSDPENRVMDLGSVPPSCESFNYSQVGATNWQTAAVSSIHELFTIISWECIGYDWGIFTQPLYFQLPINSNYNLNSGGTKIESAAYLDLAFSAFDNWYKQNGCNSGGSALEQKLLEYIKVEFEDNGGNVTLKPPMGFSGTITQYKITWKGYGDCN